MLLHWKKLTSSVVHRNPWWSYILDSFQIPGGVKGEYHYVHTEGSSLVIPVREDGRVVLVNQYRYLRDRESIEFPCGGVKAGSSYEITAKAELEEEAGFAAQSWEVVGEFNPFNGATDEMCRVFIARRLLPVPPRPEATEEFEILTELPSDVDAMIGDGRIWDGMSLAAWTLARPLLRMAG
ncbi:MAG TPA: NUDIX hydrolase [Bacteroidota bacterium]|nr:NUDIX hydrolase [Bacteroidota bacterium]